MAVVFKSTERSTKPSNTFKATKRKFYDTAIVDNWKNANKEAWEALNGYNQRLNGKEWMSSEDIDGYKSALDKYISTSNSLRGINKIFGEGYSDEDEKKWQDSVSSMNTDYDGISKYYSQFDSEKTYGQYLSLLADREKQEEYKALIGTSEGLSRGTQGWKQYINDKAKAESAKEDVPWWEKLLGYLGTSPDTTLPTSNASQAINDMSVDNSDRVPRNDWTSEQQGVFGYLYSEDPSSAYEYATFINGVIDKEKENNAIKNIQEAATSGFGAGLGHTIGAIASAPFGLADYLSDLTEGNAKGYITPDGNVSPFEYSQAVTGGISENLNDRFGTINENVPILGGKGFGDLYGLGTSIAQSAISGYTLGGAGTLISYFGQGAASGVDDALSRGASEEQAVLYGAALGTFEGVAEEIGIDNLFKLGSADSLKGIIKNILRQAGAEGMEEGFTSVLSNIADAFIMQDKSNFAYQLAAYKNQGLSESEAKWKVFWDSIESIAFDTIGGFVSGGVHSGAHTALQNAIENNAAKKQYGDSVSDLINRGLEIGGEAATIAQKYKEKLESGKELSGSDIKAMVRANERELAAQDKSQVKADTKTNDANGQTDIADTDIAELVSELEAEAEAGNVPQAQAESAEAVTEAGDAQEARTGTVTEYSNVTEAQTSAEADTVQTAPNASKGVNTEADAAYKMAFDMGKSGLPFSLLSASSAVQGLSEEQKKLAYNEGKLAAITEASDKSNAAKSAANGKTGRKKGNVSAVGVTLKELRESFNDTQGTAYKFLSSFAQVTGVDIVLYRSSADENGDLMGAAGKFAAKSDKIYIDVNAGLRNVSDVGDLTKYTMLRTFTHEFVHFIEKWNAARYNELRELVFARMAENGTDAHALVQSYVTDGMSYDDASREAVAEAMADVLPDSEFVYELAEKHKSVFDKLVDKLREFRDTLREYFASIQWSGTKESAALKKQTEEGIAYYDDIVKMFDKAAVEAVETYQAARATEEESKGEKENGGEQTEEKGAGTSSGDAGRTEEDQSRSRSEGSDRSRIQSDAEETDRKRAEISSGTSFGRITDEHPFGENAYTSAPNDSFIDNTVRTIIDDYCIECRIVKESAWTRENPACIKDGIIYVSEKINEATLKTLAFHEPTHAMKHYRNKRYMEFIDNVPGYLAMRSKGFFDLMETVKKHCGIDYFKLGEHPEDTEADKIKKAELYIKFYDELNATVYGFAKGGIIGDKEYDYGFDWVPSAFKDFDGYIKELSDIHEQFKAERKKASGTEDATYNTEETNPESRAETADEKTEKPDVSAPATEDGSKTPSEKLADIILDRYLNDANIGGGKKKLASSNLYLIANTCFGGTQAEGAYDRKDAYDALELAVNKYLLSKAKEFNGDAEKAREAVKFMEEMLGLLPTQTVRSKEQEEYQQFSTPPNIAYLAAWAANITEGSRVLEPSAGIGGLAVFAKSWGADVTVNELSKRRLGVLKHMGFDRAFNENAEHINDVLPDDVTPDTVIMNPPFSSTAGRTQNNKTSNAEMHIDSALARLADGGRLVAILGKGMNDADYGKYWNKLRKTYNIRANISIDGNNYKKYGTTYGVQLVVIDKTGAQTGETVTGAYSDLTEIPAILEVIRNDRRRMEEGGNIGGGHGMDNTVSDGGDRQPAKRHDGDGKRDTGDSPGNKRNGDRKSVRGSGEVRSGVDGGNGASDNSEGTRGDGRSVGAGTSGDTGKSDGTAESDGSARPEPEPSRRLNDAPEDDGVYSSFVLPDVPVKGGKAHPAVLVESAAMAAVSMPKATYTPKLPADVVKNNLSDAQMVTVTYAGQAHEQFLPDGQRRGFFIGDGTGVGKGRQIAGIILDNFMQGREKAVWVSKNKDLYGDAVRDWTSTTGRPKSEITEHGKTAFGKKIALDKGIIFTTYDTLKSSKNGTSRLDQIVEWLGKDFDGVIAYDEAHNMGNLFGKSGKFGKSKGSMKASAGVELQRRLPKARIVYVSATAATEVENLAYAERAGLWGRGTAFGDARDFISKIGSSGLAAMELVIRDMKAMGTYVARSISYSGVTYNTVEHNLTQMQTEIYNTMSRAWQKTMSKALSALETTRGKYNSDAQKAAIGGYYSAMQRFYNQALTSMAMPSVIADMKKELAAGHSCVLQIVNTNEAQQNKQLAEAKAKGEELDDLDLTPRESLLGYLQNSFPTELYEEYTDDDGNVKSRVVTDSEGKPVHSKEAMRERDALIAEVKAMSIPDGPLEILFDTFGTEEVAENTGRSRRVVPKKAADGTVKRVEERRTLKHRTADVQAFQDGKKHILVFSDAGGTGKSYHASLSEKNQQQRIHYVLQPGWVASNAVQGFGRTHRSNEASAPIYKLVTTNIKGQKRFTSTIARRLDQLGALTKGQRDTGSGMFGSKDNLETDLAKDSLREFYKRLGKNLIPGIDGTKVLTKLGLKEKFTDEHGGFKLSDQYARDISTFLNRILVLEVDEQNEIFDTFTSIYETELEAAIAAGTLDIGMENVKADKIEIIDDKVIRAAENESASTHYIQAKTYTKPKIVTTVDGIKGARAGFEGIFRTDTGAVKAVFRIADKTTEYGAITKQYRLIGPNLGASPSVWSEKTLKERAKPVQTEQWQSAWEEEIGRVPEYNEDTLHMLTGALLPIWNSLPQEGNTKVKRLIASDGTTHLGRVIDKNVIDGILGRFSVGRTKETYDAKKVMDKAMKDGTHFRLRDNRASVFRSRVSGEWRLEIAQQNPWYLQREYPEIIYERIQYRDRYFIPTGEKGLSILEGILKNNPVENTEDEKEQYQRRNYTLTNREVLERALDKIDRDKLTEGEKYAVSVFEERLGKLRDLQEQRAEAGAEYKAFYKGLPESSDSIELQNKIKILGDQIRKASDELFEIERKDVLRGILNKSRDVVEEIERAHAAEYLKKTKAKMREAEARRKYKAGVERLVADFVKYITKPTNKADQHHVPEVLKDSIIPFLNSIDLSSKRLLKGKEATIADGTFLKNLDRIKDALAEVSAQGVYEGMIDLPPDFIDTMDEYKKAISEKLENDVSEFAEKFGNNGFIVNRMSAEELHELYGILKTLKEALLKINRFHENAIFKSVSEAGEDTISELNALKPRKEAKNGLSKFTANMNDSTYWRHIRPAYAFERMGKGATSIYKTFLRGQEKLAFLTKQIVDFAEKAYTAKEVKAWEKQKISVKIGDNTLEMTAAQAMSLYCLSRRKQAQGHIYGKGVRPAGASAYSATSLTEDDVQNITEQLTDRQIEVAEKLQRYMSVTGGEWGNEVSVRRFGVKMFGEENYFPIASDGKHFDVSDSKKPANADLYALLNLSFTKELTEGANNAIILYSIFDVFANHMSSMAQYNALALPVLDALRWINYKKTHLEKKTVESEKKKIKREISVPVVDDTVRKAMEKAFGSPYAKGDVKRGYAESFILGIIKGFSGTSGDVTPSDQAIIDANRRYNMAQVAFNVRSVVQQPLSIIRAANILSPAAIALSLKDGASSEMRKDMLSHSGIAAWKSLGFYDVNISRGVEHLIKHDETALEKIIDVGLAGAETADTVTWTAIWSACRRQIAKNKALKTNSEEYYRAVSELFAEVITKTQVVDSILTKSEFMRSKGTGARVLSSFMSEPVCSASMAMSAFDKFNMSLRKGADFGTAWKRHGKEIGRMLTVWSASALTLAAVTAAIDALRDDDEYEEWSEKWWDAFWGNLIDELSPFNKLPIMADIYEFVKETVSLFGIDDIIGIDIYGNSPSTLTMQWAEPFLSGMQIMIEKQSGEKTNYTWWSGIKKLLSAASGISGLPVGNISRTLVTAYNSVIAHFAPSLVIRDYDTTTAEHRQALYEAMLEGDDALAESIAQNFEDDKDVDAAIRRALRDNDPRIRKAAEARIGGDPYTCMDIIWEIADEGIFDESLIADAVDAEANYLREQAKKNG